MIMHLLSSILILYTFKIKIIVYQKYKHRVAINYSEWFIYKINYIIAEIASMT